MAEATTAAIAISIGKLADAVNNAISVIFDPKSVKLRAELKRLKKMVKAIDYGQRYIRCNNLHMAYIRSTIIKSGVQEEELKELMKYEDKLADIENDFFKYDQ